MSKTKTETFPHFSIRRRRVRLAGAAIGIPHQKPLSHSLSFSLTLTLTLCNTYTHTSIEFRERIRIQLPHIVSIFPCVRSRRRCRRMVARWEYCEQFLIWTPKVVWSARRPSRSVPREFGAAHPNCLGDSTPQPRGALRGSLCGTPPLWKRLGEEARWTGERRGTESLTLSIARR